MSPVRSPWRSEARHWAALDFQLPPRITRFTSFPGFGGPREAFFSNLELALSDRVKFRFIEKDFRAVDFGSIGSFDIYLFDGPHEEADQYDGVVLAQPALTRRYLLVVDDWNWRAVRNGTFRALIDTQCRIEAALEVRTSLDDSHPVVAMEQSEWHNGYFIAVIVKRRK